MLTGVSASALTLTPTSPDRSTLFSTATLFGTDTLFSTGTVSVAPVTADTLTLTGVSPD